MLQFPKRIIIKNESAITASLPFMRDGLQRLDLRLAILHLFDKSHFYWTFRGALLRWTGSRSTFADEVAEVKCCVEISCGCFNGIQFCMKFSYLIYHLYYT